MLILITDKCNLACRHCMQKASPKNNTFMSKELFSECLKKAEQLGARLINIAGGEPTIVDSSTLKGYISSALERGFIVTLETNGSFLEDNEKVEMLTEIAKTYGEFFIQISSFKEYYTNCDAVTERIEHGKGFRELRRLMGGRLSIACEETADMQIMALGRASEGEMLEVAKRYDRFPSCTNSALIAKQMSLTDKPCLTLENFGRFCVPMIDAEGGVHMGESVFCKRICSIEDNAEDIAKGMQSYKPCGKCHNYHWHFDNPTTMKERQVYELLKG